jgi:DNA-binding response OmpR family regulator
MLNIALIEDNDFLRKATIELLRASGFQAEGFFCAEDLDDVKNVGPYDIYIIDLNLPGESGFRLARRLRQIYPHSGIIIFSAREETTDRVDSYGCGADIYMPKSAHPDEFIAAVFALARRIKPQGDSSMIRLSMDQCNLEGPGGVVSVTPSEAILLNSFVAAPLQFLEHWQVSERIFGQNEPNKASLEVRVVYLRKKLIQAGAKPPAIMAVRGKGYRLVCPVIVQQ